MRVAHRLKRTVGIFLAIMGTAALLGCSGHSGRMAAQGATTGAVAGAVGGLVSGLVFGGNPMERAAQGAVIGASSGAVAGGMAGARADQAEKSRRDEQLAKLKKEIGTDAYNGLEALAGCKHEVALANAKTAAKSDNKNFALAGLWLEVLTYADSREEEKARVLFPELVSRDPKLGSEAGAEEKMRKALQGLMDIREEYGLPRVCGS